MSLFTAEGLLRAEYRGHHKGITTYPGLVYHSYLRWLKTQGMASTSPAFEYAIGKRKTVGSLSSGELGLPPGQTLHNGRHGLPVRDSEVRGNRDPPEHTAVTVASPVEAAPSL